MRSVYIIAVSCTAFGKRPDATFQQLTEEAYLDVLADCGMDRDGSLIEQCWFGNCGLGNWGQGGIRGQVCFTPLIERGWFPEHVPILNVEGACATSSLALHGAWKDVLSGQTEVSLAIGVEKLISPDVPERGRQTFDGAIDQLDPARWRDYYAHAGEQLGKPFALGPDRTVFMDTYAMQAVWHMHRYGTTRRQIAAGAAKNHYHGSLNPKAQYRFTLSVDEVLSDREISYPLTRAMCSPLSDGAAAAIVCSEAALANFSSSVRDRAVKVRASALSGGKYRKLDEPGLSMHAARKAYEASGLRPGDIDLVELHDATSFSELFQLEMLGFCEPGRSGAFVEAGETTLGGRLPVNVSGGLVSKGHPIGATGLSMMYEVTRQLRDEAGPSQVKNARIGLIENGGGVMGFDEAVCAVTVLERSV